MLAQLTILLALGVLCSPAPTTTYSCCYKVYTILEEITSHLESTAATAGLSSVPMDIRDKTCLRNNLKTFIESLKTNGTEEESGIVFQLNRVHECERLFSNITPTPQVPDKECRTAQVSREKFKEALKTFFIYLSDVLPEEKDCI
ncbi:colony stimulating factor 2 precursor [Gallus gallus]|uniref:Colony stimulating factor 2 n=1 Tax=Gallus gallus TaxID=9031 RepID=Q5W4T7_CHICK|eukprot:NP_001007079.1 colony stimulating factor 2 precursor [Gallus gallus]